MVIPQAMAYATIAGLPVEVGLYTCMLPMLVYALLGGSRSLSISTTSTIAILTASAISALPVGPVRRRAAPRRVHPHHPGRPGLLAMRLFRLGSLVEQISPATMTGVKTGVGLTVAATQLPTLLGIAGDAEDEGFFGKLADTLSRLGDANLATVAGVGRGDRDAARCCAGSPRRCPGRWWSPWAASCWSPLTDVEERGLVAHRHGALRPADADDADAGATSARCCPARWPSR